MPEMNAVREGLLAKRDELEERLRRIDRDLRKREEPMSADFAEQVVEQENLDVLYSLEAEGRMELVRIKRTRTHRQRRIHHLQPLWQAHRGRAPGGHSLCRYLYRLR